jgi:hypothetical protein
MKLPSALMLASCCAVVLAGCGDGGDAGDGTTSPPAAASAAAAPDPCSLITKAEAEAAIGAAVTGPDKSSGMGNFDQCQYQYSGERLTDVGAVTVQVEAVDLASKQKAFADAADPTEPVSGIGDAAFWAPGHSALFVGKGNLTTSFSVTRQGIDMKAASRALAEKGVARLP